MAKIYYIAAAVLTILMVCTTNLMAADTDTTDIDEGIIAKMARLKGKQMPGVNQDSNANGGDSESLNDRINDTKSNATCGAINIGNVDMGKRRTGPAPRQVIVIIKGDVTNANNKCKGK